MGVNYKAAGGCNAATRRQTEIIKIASKMAAATRDLSPVQQVEKAIESSYACRQRTFWTVIVSLFWNVKSYEQSKVVDHCVNGVSTVNVVFWIYQKRKIKWTILRYSLS